MKLDQRFENIMGKVFEGKGPDKEECLYLLDFAPHSLESTHMMSIANSICRSRLNNCGVIYAQIAIDISPCAANCEFCAFAAGYSDIEPHRMSTAEIRHAVETLSAEGDLFGIFLMTMENVDIPYVIDAVKTARSAMAPHQQLWVNIGDITHDEAIDLKNAGVMGAYHAIRLREGEDTNLDPGERLKTIEALKKAELQVYTCCEPIGPEHSAEEIVDRVFMNYEHRLVQQSVMRRTFIPGLPISKRGTISQMRLAQITAVVALSALSHPEVMAVACHEPNLLGLTAGSNIVSAEWGANPREDTGSKAEKLGLTMNDCRRMLFEAGYSAILASNLEQVPLNEAYLAKTGAI